MSDEEERGGAFYDVPATFERYTAGRGPDASDPAWVMEEPAFLAALGDVRGARESTDEPRGAWVVDDYFARGPRPQVWLDGVLTWHHRTTEDHVASLLRAGFRLDSLSECEPVRERFGDDEAEHARRRRVPLFLLLAATVT